MSETGTVLFDSALFSLIKSREDTIIYTYIMSKDNFLVIQYSNYTLCNSLETATIFPHVASIMLLPRQPINI